MKRYTPFLFGALFGVLLLAAFTLGQVAAAPMTATGCFPDTNGHWAETFICWAAEKGIVTGFPNGTFGPNQGITRAQAAVMLNKQAEIPPTTGEHYFNIGPNAWLPNSGTGVNAYVQYYTIRTRLNSSVTGTKGFQVTPTLPSTFYNNYTFFKGVLLCYKTEGTAYITSITMRHEKFYGATGTNATLNTFTDSTNRSGYACRLYEFTMPMSYYPDNVLLFIVDVQYPDTAGYVDIYSTAFVLEASDNGPGYIYDTEALSIPGSMQEVNPDAVPAYGPESGE